MIPTPLSVDHAHLNISDDNSAYFNVLDCLNRSVGRVYIYRSQPMRAEFEINNETLEIELPAYRSSAQNPDLYWLPICVKMADAIREHDELAIFSAEVSGIAHLHLREMRIDLGILDDGLSNLRWAYSRENWMAFLGNAKEMRLATARFVRRVESEIAALEDQVIDDAVAEHLEEQAVDVADAAHDTEVNDRAILEHDGKLI